MKKTIRESLHFRGRYHLLFTMKKDNINKLIGSLKAFKNKNFEYRIKDIWGYFNNIRQLDTLHYFVDVDGIKYVDNFIVISPKESEFNNIIKYISLTIFNLSDEYIGLSFLFCLKDEYVNDLNIYNDKIISDINIYQIDCKKKFVNTIEDLKLKTFKYIKDNFPFFEENEMICLDEFNYYLGYNIQSTLLPLYDFDDCFSSNNTSNLVIDIFTRHSVKINYCFIKNPNVDSFSYSLLLKRNKVKQEYLIHDFYLIGNYIYVISSYYFYKYKKLVKEKKNQLQKFYLNPKEKKYKQFIEINKKIDFVKDHIYVDMIYYYKPDLTEKEFLCLKKQYINVSKKNEEIEKDYVNILNVNNLTSSYRLAAFAVILAIVSIIIDLNIISSNLKIFIVLLIIIFYIIFNTIF